MIPIKSLVKQLRQFRSVHRWIGISLAVFFVVTAITGLLLGWKKNVETLQPATRQGTSPDLLTWKSFDEVARAAQYAMDSVRQGESNVIDRMDVRPKDGIIKVLFKSGYWEAQVDGKTGKVLSVAQRHSDWIEHIHDGSIINDFFKLGYVNVLGLGLMLLAITGVWLWYGPKVIRRSK